MRDTQTATAQITCFPQNLVSWTRAPDCRILKTSYREKTRCILTIFIASITHACTLRAKMVANAYYGRKILVTSVSAHQSTVEITAEVKLSLRRITSNSNYIHFQPIFKIPGISSILLKFFLWSVQKKKKTCNSLITDHMENCNLDRGFVPTLQSQSVFFFYVEFFVTCLTFLVQISHTLPVVTSRFYDCESNALKGEPDLCQYLYNQIRTLILTEICCGSTTVCIWTFTEKKVWYFFSALP